MFNRRWRRLTQIRNLSPQTMGLGFEPSVILGIGFIQIESVKSVVKKSGDGFGCGSAESSDPWFKPSLFPPFPPARIRGLLRYSHSIVAGGLELMSSTTRLTPRTSLVMRLEITCNRSGGKRAQSAVMASMLSTTRRAMT